MDTINKSHALDLSLHRTYDLHLHTYWSYDAGARPESYFRFARTSSVRCIAITDHHVLDGQEEILAASTRYPEVRFILAAELTVTTSFGAVDLLCYGFPARDTPTIARLKSVYHAWQQDHGAAISRGMQDIGCDFSDADRMKLLQSYRPDKVIAVQGNTQVKYGLLREYFLERRFIAKPQEFGPLLERAEKGCRFPQYPDVATVLPLVKDAGALVAIAHPFGYFKQADIYRMDALREECGFDGIECAHPEIPVEYSPVYRSYCEKHGLFSTGGTDCHTDDAAALENFACHAGEESWLEEFLERIS